MNLIMDKIKREGLETARFPTVKVVGSNPAGPTKSLFRVNKRFYGIVFKNSLKRSDLNVALAN